MPLLYTTHSPPPLLHELRMLARKVDLAESRTGGEKAVVEPTTPEPEAPVEGTVLAWTKLIELNKAQDGAVTFTREYTVASITGAYTHLEMDLVLLVAGGNGVTAVWTLRGDKTKLDWFLSEPVPGEGEVHVGRGLAFHYQEFALYSIGHFRPLPSVDPDNFDDGDLAYFPITPQSGRDALKLLVKVIIPTDPVPTNWCLSAWVVGRYVLHDAGLFGSGAICPGA